MRTVIVSLFLLFSMTAIEALAQCDQKALLKSALTELDDGQYIRDFVVDFNSPKDEKPSRQMEYSVILNGHCQYKFKLVYASSSTDKVKMRLFDEDKLVGSNIGGSKVYDAFGFICKSTKIYKLVFSYDGSNEECARAILALQKQFSEKEMGF